MATQKKYSQEFKNDAVEYRKSHAELSLKTCAANLGVSPVSLREWIKATDDTGKVVMRGSGNYASDEQKEIDRLKRELRDTKDALEILKKAIGILGK